MNDVMAAMSRCYHVRDLYAERQQLSDGLKRAVGQQILCVQQGGKGESRTQTQSTHG